MFHNNDSRGNSPQTDQPVVPLDFTRGSYHSTMGPLPQHTVAETASTSEKSNTSLKTPRTARFAEATSIYSPVENAQRSPFADPPKSGAPTNVGDMGFGYVKNDYHADDQVPMSPFRPGLKVPQTAKSLNPLSPTFREEYMLEKQEHKADKENARDVVRTIPRPNPYIVLTPARESNFASALPRSSCVLSTSAAVSLCSRC